MALKNFTQGMEFPRDFWNYHVNPITGFNTFDTGLTDDEP